MVEASAAVPISQSTFFGETHEYIRSIIVYIADGWTRRKTKESMDGNARLCMSCTNPFLSSSHSKQMIVLSLPIATNSSLSPILARLRQLAGTLSYTREKKVLVSLIYSNKRCVLAQQAPAKQHTYVRSFIPIYFLSQAVESPPRRGRRERPRRQIIPRLSVLSVSAFPAFPFRNSPPSARLRRNQPSQPSNRLAGAKRLTGG